MPLVVVAMLDVLVSASDSNSDMGVIVIAGPNPGDKSLLGSAWVTLIEVTEGYWKDTSDPFLAGGDPNLMLVQDCLLGLPGTCPALDLIKAANPSSLLESFF